MPMITWLRRFAHPFSASSGPVKGFNGNLQGWVGVDLDGTLAKYHGWVGIEHIGDPVPAMLERVKGWLAHGIEVRIFTARVCHPAGKRVAIRAIGDWCEMHGLPRLSVTNAKDFGMIELWDDRVVRVLSNSGEPANGEYGSCVKPAENNGPAPPAEPSAKATGEAFMVTAAGGGVAPTP